MDFRFLVISLFLGVVFLVAFSGCTSAPAAQSTTTLVSTNPVAAEKTYSSAMGMTDHTPATSPQSIAEQMAAVKSDNTIWKEAYRMFQNIKSTEYVHPPYTDNDAVGIYKFDCLGFVDHVLMNVDSAGYKKIGKGLNPSIESYSTYFNKLDTTKPDAAGWIRVVHPTDLKPVDTCLWLKPSTLDLGHMWIIAGEPKVNPKRTDEVFVRIFDSTGMVHSSDSRTGSAYKTGLGTGVLGFMVDNAGSPTGLYWEGGASNSAGEKDTTIVCGRLNQ